MQKELIVGIVGLGLMGGSFAKVLKKYNISSNIIGYDHNKSHQEEALSLGLVNKIVGHDELLKADLVVLCIPVEAIIKFLPSLVACKDTTTIMDFGSTKELIINNIPTEVLENYIPAHPMTGTEKNGPSAAIDDFYEHKTIVLCDIDKCKLFHKNRVIDIFTKINMNLVFMGSKEHDIHAGYISHLPHLISYALANTVMSHENPSNIVSLAAGGFKDMSRIAKSSPDMWADIFTQNKTNLLESIIRYEDQMNQVKQMILNDEYDKLKNWMSKANTLHDIL